MRRAIVMLAVAFWSRDARAQLTVSGSPAQLKVSTAVAGSAPLAVTNSTTTYSVTSNPSTGHFAITARINSAMPAGVTLTVALAANRGTSLGAVALSTTAQNVVTTITRKMSLQAITYTLSATAAAGVVPLQSRVVTLTIISTP